MCGFIVGIMSLKLGLEVSKARAKSSVSLPVDQDVALRYWPCDISVTIPLPLMINDGLSLGHCKQAPIAVGNHTANSL